MRADASLSVVSEASLTIPDVTHLLPYGSNSPTTAHA